MQEKSPVCQRCNRATNYEMALVDGHVWCHPCADGPPETELEKRGIDEAYRRYDGSAAQRLAFNFGVKWCLEQIAPAANLTEVSRLEGTLRKLIQAVKTYQFTPDGCPEKAMSAADLDDAVDDAKAALQSQS